MKFCGETETSLPPPPLPVADLEGEPGLRPYKGCNSVVLTLKHSRIGSSRPPQEVGAPMGNPGSATPPSTPTFASQSITVIVLMPFNVTVTLRHGHL